MCLSWLTAIRMPEAVMKPAMTGWLRKLARKPSQQAPSQQDAARQEGQRQRRDA
jgi:hypothetical protein